MKTIKDLNESVGFELDSRQLANIVESTIVSKGYKQLKRLFYITSLIGVALLLNSCVGGYIVTEPVYVESSRPPQPSSMHIWIEGDWFWSNQTHTYVQRNGYWVKPRPNHTYVSGYWQTSPKGRYWKQGHWQKQRNNNNRRNR